MRAEQVGVVERRRVGGVVFSTGAGSGRPARGHPRAGPRPDRSGRRRDGELGGRSPVAMIARRPVSGSMRISGMRVQLGRVTQGVALDRSRRASPGWRTRPDGRSTSLPRAS